MGGGPSQLDVSRNGSQVSLWFLCDFSMLEVGVVGCFVTIHRK